MELAQLETLVGGLMAGLPEQVTECLEDVDVILAETPAEATKELLADQRKAAAENKETLSVEETREMTLPDDTKGVFIGDPLERSEDVDPDTEESEILYDAEGYLVMCASNIADKDECLLVFLHELGHALGLDEAEVKELGLAVAQAKEGKLDANATQHAANDQGI